VKKIIEWQKPEPKEYDMGIRLKIEFKGTLELQFVTWHHKGDYFATVCPEGNTNAVLVHQLSKMQSQNPFTKSKGRVTCVRFHPSRPEFFVVGQQRVRIYDLSKQKLLKKLIPGVNWISSLHIHSGGDNLLIGTYDKKVCWFDLDYGSKPYKSMSYHKSSVRSVRYHPQYPLFSSCSDDGLIHIFHGKVYDDLLQNAFILPLKVLRGHRVYQDMGVLDIMFHPFQPWVFSCGGDATIRLWV
jgi:ribosome biogenesis protein ERB1